MALSTTFHNQSVSVGDTIRVSQKVHEGEKDRIQQFQGVVIAIKGNSGERSVTVRKIAAGGIGVERIFPADLPSISAVTVAKHGIVRRAKLYYLREREGKASLQLPERIAGGTKRSHGRTRETSRGRRARVPQKETPSLS